MKKELSILIILLFVASCNRASKSAQNASVPKEYHFKMIQPPPQATDADRYAYMAEHYWDKFDFNDTVFISKVDTIEMLQAFATYVGNFVNPFDGESLRKIVKRAATSKRMFEYFSFLAEQVLHDPNSPLRNDEQYIPVLEERIASPYVDEYERLVPEYDLRLAKQNRIGSSANDFQYTLANGRTYNLYSLQSEYVLLFINNPGCPMCKTIQEDIVSSPMLTEMQERGALKVLALYPDEDLNAWRSYIPSMPREWIIAYNKGCVIRNGDIHDLRAIPAMYLMDVSKRVLVKDSTSVPQIEYTIDTCLP